MGKGLWSSVHPCCEGQFLLTGRIRPRLFAYVFRVLSHARDLFSSFSSTSAPLFLSLGYARNLFGEDQVALAQRRSLQRLGLRPYWLFYRGRLDIIMRSIAVREESH